MPSYAKLKSNNVRATLDVERKKFTTVLKMRMSHLSYSLWKEIKNLLALLFAFFLFYALVPAYVVLKSPIDLSTIATPSWISHLAQAMSLLA